MLYDIGSPKASGSDLIAKRHMLPAAAFIQVFSSALRAWPADRVYQEFASLLELKKQDDKIRIERDDANDQGFLLHGARVGPKVKPNGNSTWEGFNARIVWDPALARCRNQSRSAANGLQPGPPGPRGSNHIPSVARSRSRASAKPV